MVGITFMVSITFMGDTNDTFANGSPCKKHISSLYIPTSKKRAFVTLFAKTLHEKSQCKCVKP